MSGASCSCAGLPRGFHISIGNEKSRAVTYCATGAEAAATEALPMPSKKPHTSFAGFAADAEADEADDDDDDDEASFAAGAASTNFLSSIAANEAVWTECAEALQSQVGGKVGLEVGI